MFQNLRHRTEREEEYKDMDLKSSKRGFHRSPGTNSSVVKGNETRLVRCVHCGFPCDRERDPRSSEDSWVFLGINYGSQQTASASVGDSKNPTPDTNTSLLIKYNDLTDDTGKTVTNSGVSVSSSDFIYGGACGVFSGTASLSLVSNSAFSFGTGNFTATTWVKFSSLTGTQTIISQYKDANNYWSLDKSSSSNKLSMTFVSAGVTKGSSIMTSAWSVSTNIWYQIVWERIGSGGYIGVSGIQQAVTDTNLFLSNDVGDNGGTLYIGQKGDGTQFLSGKLDDTYLYKGTAKFTSGAYKPVENFYYTTSGVDKYYERTVLGGCPCCGSPIYDKKPQEIE